MSLSLIWRENFILAVPFSKEVLLKCFCLVDYYINRIICNQLEALAKYYTLINLQKYLTFTVYCQPDLVWKELIYFFFYFIKMVKRLGNVLFQLGSKTAISLFLNKL